MTWFGPYPAIALLSPSIVGCVAASSNVFARCVYWYANAFARLIAWSALCATTVKCSVLAVESAVTDDIATNCLGEIEPARAFGSWTVSAATCVEDPMVACVAT